ncbi:hypothetical protein GGR54DRAFT_241906 [Hypoxylon sp. NC1633]|nr:hypothetical protein GGR54DRAFT_241906 [Hypoxylon sp. NC1633]
MSNPSKLDSSMEDMWRDATARFNERTGMNVNLRPPKTLNDCIKELEKSQLSEESHEPTRKEKVEEYGINILRCLKLLGGVAAQGAEVVFGSPSSVCFNAVFLLMDIPEQLKSFREAIDELFTIISPYLGIFRIYDKMEQFNNIEPELKQAIHAVMISFVDICALAIQLRDSRKWQRFKSRMKILLTKDDSGMKVEIEKFERLTKTHYSAQSTQALKILLETSSDLTQFLERESERSQQIATDVASLKASDERRNLEDNRRKHMDNIKKKLGIEDSLYKSFKQACDKPRDERIRNTAEWFKNLPQFKSWEERDSRESEILFLVTGASNTGKTVILSNMVHHLRSIYESPTRNESKTLIAACFFPNVTVKDDRDKRPISTALKCIAIQIADLDATYAKNLSQSCDNKSEDSSFFKDADCQELWDFLRIGSPRGNIVHYLIFDGLGGLPDESPDTRAQKEQLLRILYKSVQSSVRVLLSVRRDAFSVEDRPSHSSIEMEQHNELDIQEYISHYLKESDLFQDSEDEALSARVAGSLTKQVRGNYNKLKAALEKIKEVVASDGLEAEIDKVLAESSMTEKQITQTTIAQLEERLTGEEIDELNELLIWVICGMEPFTVDELNAALVLRSQRRGTLRLKKKLERKYSSILRINPGGRVGVQENIKDLLTKRRTKPRSADDNPKFSATISIMKGDFRSVQTFLWSLSQKIDSLAHDEFGFQQISEQQRVKNNIQVNEVDGNYTIIRRTFKLLAGEPNKESKELGSYLLRALPDHLDEITKKASGYEELTSAQKREIGEGLFTLFVTGEVVERHWDSCQVLSWYGDPDQVSIFRNWLDDTSATSHLGWLDREWLKGVKANQNPNQALLVKIMETVARHWLRERKWEATKAFQWLKGFRQIAPPSTTEPKDTPLPPSPKLTPQDSDEVTNVLEWCNGVLSITTDEDEALKSERLGETYFGEKQFPKAIESYNHAISLDSPGWKCFEGLAKALAGDRQYENACQTMEKALKILGSEDIPDRDPLISANYGCLAEWQLALEQPRRAVEYMRRAIEVTPGEDKAYFELLKIHLLNHQFDDAVAFLKDVIKLDNNKSGTSLLGRIVDATAEDSKTDNLFGSLFRALAEESDMFVSLLHEIDQAIERATKNARLDNKANMLLFKGVGVYRYGPDESMRVQQAMLCWEQSLNVDLSSWYTWTYPHIFSSIWLSKYYFDQAQASKQLDNPDLDPYLQKLKWLVEKIPSTDYIGTKTYLANFYARAAGDVQNARKVLRRHFDSAFDMLSDSIDDNDWQGYVELGHVLKHCGDDVNAAYAHLILLPTLGKGTNAGDTARWVLEFDTEAEQKLSDELVTAMERDFKGLTTSDQIDFLLKRVERALSEIKNGEDAATPNSNGQDAGGTTDETTHIPENSTKTTSDEQSAVPSSSTAINSDEATGEHNKSTTDGKLEGKDDKTAYEAIQRKLQEWSSVLQATSSWRGCDGCGKVWDLDHAMNTCKYCYNVDFCDECLVKLKAGKLSFTSMLFQCNKNHDWLHFPSWDKEMYLRALNKTVSVGGHIDEEGRFVGGKTVPVAEWLDGLKKEWGVIEKKDIEQASEPELDEMG